MAGRPEEGGAREVFGPRAINAEKKEEEGEFVADQICRGAHANTEEETVRLPEEKVRHIKILLEEPAYDVGNAQVALRDVCRSCAEP